MKKSILLAATFAMFVIGCSSDDDSNLIENPPIDQPAGAQKFKSVSSWSHTVAVKEDGTLWTAGYNANGELGNGTVSSDWAPPAQVGTDSDWKFVAACEGGFHSVALKNDGSMWTWGTTFSNSLGLGDVQFVAVPTRVGSSNDWKFVTSASFCSLAIKNDGTLWGCGFKSLLGIPDDFQNVKTFTQISNQTWKEVSAGGSHVLAIRSDGTLWAWGYNQHGELGNGDMISGYSFVSEQVGNTNDWKAVFAGGSFSMAIKTDGSLWAWGQNEYGQLGLGNTTDLAIPTRVGTGNDWTAISGSNISSWALKTDGSLWICGSASELGHFVESETASYSFAKVDNNTWTQIYKGGSVIAKKSNGENWYWGANIVMGTTVEYIMQFPMSESQFIPVKWE